MIVSRQWQVDRLGGSQGRVPVHRQQGRAVRDWTGAHAGQKPEGEGREKPEAEATEEGPWEEDEEEEKRSRDGHLHLLPLPAHLPAPSWAAACLRLGSTWLCVAC